MNRTIEEQILHILSRAIQHKQGNKEYVDIGKITTTEAKDIQRLTGYNVDGYTRSLDISGIKHILNTHRILPRLIYC